jgi:hypothetical protein
MTLHRGPWAYSYLSCLNCAPEELFTRVTDLALNPLVFYLL